MKNSKFIKLFGVLVMLFISIFIYNSLNGNPIWYLKAKNNINEYIDSTVSSLTTDKASTKLYC